MRTERLLDSAISGALVEILIFPYVSPTPSFKGKPTVGPFGRGIAAAIVAASMQLIFNQSRIIRLNFLSRREKRRDTTVESSVGSSEEKSTTEQVKEAMRTPTRNPKGEKLGEKSLPGRILGTMSRFLPIQNLSDEEYLEALQKKRKEVNRKLAEIEDEEKRIYDYATRSGRAV